MTITADTTTTTTIAMTTTPADPEADERRGPTYFFIDATKAS